MELIRVQLSRVLVALAAGIFAISCSSSQEDVVAERIKSIGDVCVEGDDCAKSLTVASAGGAAKSAEDIYNTGCAACHTSGAAGAPKYRNAGDWADRLSAGLDTVYSNAINGKNGMPPKGLCPSCSDDEIKSAVDYMIEGL